MAICLVLRAGVLIQSQAAAPQVHCITQKELWHPCYCPFVSSGPRQGEEIAAIVMAEFGEIPSLPLHNVSLFSQTGQVVTPVWAGEEMKPPTQAVQLQRFLLKTAIVVESVISNPL